MQHKALPHIKLILDWTRTNHSSVAAPAAGAIREYAAQASSTGEVWGMPWYNRRTHMLPSAWHAVRLLYTWNIDMWRAAIYCVLNNMINSPQNSIMLWSVVGFGIFFLPSIVLFFHTGRQHCCVYVQKDLYPQNTNFEKDGINLQEQHCEQKFSGHTNLAHSISRSDIFNKESWIHDHIIL